MITGELSFDSNGIALLDCNRGTSDTEGCHKNIVTAFGTWCTGVQMSDCLLSEFRHRFNQSVSEHRRTNYPILGHSDTWLVDLAQRLVEHNHNSVLYPDWSNASDYKSTPESFGTVPILSPALASAINAIQVDSKSCNLTPDQQYICTKMNLNLPPLPVHGAKELILFQKLIVHHKNGAIDFDALALEWCKYVDGCDYFPKLPVYLRTHFTKWQHNQLVRDAVEKNIGSQAKLQSINKTTCISDTALIETITNVAGA
jgi:hypothetical protein